jgi:hypothetical protein
MHSSFALSLPHALAALLNAAVSRPVSSRISLQRSG